MKKVYRSLFDSDDVYEVEELTDNPEISTENIAPVKQDDGEVPAGHTIEDCWDAIQKLTDIVMKSSKGVKDDEPAVTNEVTPQAVDIDKSKPVTDEDEDEVNEDEEVEDCGVKYTDSDGECENEDKSVKDSYSRFAGVKDSVKKDPIRATQIAFQHRYDKVANK